MRTRLPIKLPKSLLIVLGWLFVAIGAVGVVLPLLPTTPFLIVALALFSRSSPRFRQMLLDNRWFGPPLKEWESHRTLAWRHKRRAFVLIALSFSVSLYMVRDRPLIQLMLLGIAAVLVLSIWRIRERE